MSDEQNTHDDVPAEVLEAFNADEVIEEPTEPPEEPRGGPASDADAPAP